MNSEVEWFVPVKFEDETLQFVADKATEALKLNSRLKNIFQRYHKEYNTSFKERCSVKSLQVMKQNHEIIFPTIIPSGLISSPRCSSITTKQDGSHSARTPVKRNRSSLSKEPKRLSFVDAEYEDQHIAPVFMKTSDSSQLLITSTNTKERGIVDDETFSSCEVEDEFSMSSNMYTYGILNFDELPETITRLTIHDCNTAYSFYESLDQQQKIDISPERKSRTLFSYDIGESSDRHFTSSPLYLNWDRGFKVSYNPEAHIQKLFGLERKPETVTSSSVHDKDIPCGPTKTPDEHKMIFTSCEKSTTPVKKTAADANANLLVISPSFFSSAEQTKVSEKPIINEQESLRPDDKSETVIRQQIECKEAKKSESFPRLCADDKEAVNIPYKKDKCETIFPSVKKEGRTPINSIVVKKVIIKTASNEEEFLSPKTDNGKPNNPELSKRKTFDYTEEAVMNTDLVDKDQESVHNQKIAKLDYGLAIDGKGTIDPADYPAMDDKDSFNTADNSSMDYKDSFNPAQDSALYDKVSFGPFSDFAKDDKESSGSSYIDIEGMSTDSSTNTDMHVSPAEKSEITEVAAYHKMSEKQSCASYLSPKGYQSDEVEDIYDISSSKKCQIRINSTSTHETTDIASSTSLMQGFSPSIKRSFDGSPLKSNRPVSDNVTFARHPFLRDNLSKTATSPRHDLAANVSSPKLDSTYLIKVEKFCQILKQRNSYLLSYHRLFHEDNSDLEFICSYLRIITAIVKIIPFEIYNEELLEIIQDFVDKASVLLRKATTWKSDVEHDLVVWKDCLKKITEMKQEMKQSGQENARDMTPRDFQRWEICFRVANQKTDDMILLRDIKRPTLLQFGHELENFIQLFMRCLLDLQLIEPSSKVSFG